MRAKEASEISVMKLNDIKETDFFGRYYLRTPNLINKNSDVYRCYYSSLNSVLPLIISREWKKSVTGFYINHDGTYKNRFQKGAVRISYFTITPDQVKEVVNHFVNKHKYLNIMAFEDPQIKRVSEKYGGEELRFRKFLFTYTLVGLDIIDKDLLNAQCLFATFRLQVMPARQPFKPHFCKTFEKQSAFYNSLSQTKRDQFWRDLAHSHDWAHFFVSMVLGCDLKEPPSPRSISEINNELQRLELLPKN